MKRILIIVLLSVAAGLALRKYLFEGVYVASGSMEPTLPVGTHFMLNKLAYTWSAPQRGDIISFVNPVDPEEGMIKRVIAIPGDRIELRDKHVILNDQPLSEPYVIHKRAKEKLDGDTMDPISVPPGHVFVMGDNRDESNDSTVWKDPRTGALVFFLPYKNIEGKVIRP